MTAASAMMGVPSAPKATGAVLAISERPDAESGENPSPISMAAGDRNRRTETRRALKKRAERKSDEQQLQPPVVADCADRALQHLELALLLVQADKEK